ncbi:hypothetical protein TorRG33x02_314910 [Trema orientale]|uniref:Uncharacterized protein n=1 Tax=Trema orientale TaxID=63057 RepID=A0A2P5BNI6_TREOI|nr:hypothetical protein TorRG33x02_314910 [Trema orientale]
MRLKEIKHIKDLKHNLISLGALEAARYTSKIRRGTLEVWLEFTKVMECVKQNNLYIVLRLATNMTREKAQVAEKVQGRVRPVAEDSMRVLDSRWSYQAWRVRSKKDLG